MLNGGMGTLQRAVWDGHPVSLGVGYETNRARNAGDPVWQGTLRMSDGRTFITDGGLAVDVAVARPAMFIGRATR